MSCVPSSLFVRGNLEELRQREVAEFEHAATEERLYNVESCMHFGTSWAS